MRAYGQKKAYGHYITRVVRYKRCGKIHIHHGVKNHKRERAIKIKVEED